MHRGHQTQSILAKTNQKLNISYISILRHKKEKFFSAAKSLINQHWSSDFCYIHSKDSSLQFTLRYRIYLKFQLLLNTLGGLFITTIHTSLQSLWKFRLLLHTLVGLFIIIITTINTLLRSLFEGPTLVKYTWRTLH